MCFRSQGKGCLGIGGNFGSVTFGRSAGGLKPFLFVNACAALKRRSSTVAQKSDGRGVRRSTSFYGIIAMEPLGPTIKAPPSGNGLRALNWIPDFLLGLMRVGSLGGRKSKTNFGPTM